MTGNKEVGTKGNQDTCINITDDTLENNLDCRQGRMSVRTNRRKKGAIYPIWKGKETYRVEKQLLTYKVHCDIFKTHDQEK